MGERQGPIQPPHPEAPLAQTGGIEGYKIPPAPEYDNTRAYLRGAFNLVNCLNFSEVIGILPPLTPEQRSKLTVITGQSATRPQQDTEAYAQSIEVSKLWSQAAHAAITRMFKHELSYREDGAQRPEEESLDLWTRTLLLSDQNPAKKSGIEGFAKFSWEHRNDPRLTSETVQNMVGTFLPVWCGKEGGFSADILSNMNAAKELYQNLWNLSAEVSPTLLEQYAPRRR